MRQIADEAAKNILCKDSKYTASGCIEFCQKNIFLSVMSRNSPFQILRRGQKRAIVPQLFLPVASGISLDPHIFIQTELSFLEKCLLFGN